MISQPDNTNISRWQKSFLGELREHLVEVIEGIKGAEADGDNFEISYRLYSLLVPFDQKYTAFHEAGAGFDPIDKENFTQVAQASSIFLQFLANMLVRTAAILNAALQTGNYSDVLGQFDNEVTRSFLN